MTKHEMDIKPISAQIAIGKRKFTKKTRRCLNFLPAHIGASFQCELIDLVDQLALTEGFKGAYLQSQLLSKYCDSSTTPPDERSSAALAKWLSTEDRNSRTNQRLLIGDVDFGWTTSDQVITYTRKFIRDVIGDEPDPFLFVGSNHTNGASSRVGRSVTAAASKCTGTAHVTELARGHWSQLMLNTHLEDQPLELVESSVLFTVPKSSHIDRVACKEPEVNMFLQRAAGDFIRSRLLRFGINLNDQTINQNLARDALHLGLATVDLSSASDSISKQLVFELLPFKWWSLLDDIRSHNVLLPDGSTHHLEMFSSMGNGFTFELESLIFWALTRSIARITATKGRISVYGDDIICSSSMVPALTQIFNWVGFTVNTKKSHWTGPFRESCGKHYHNSLDVSPFFIREPVKSKTDIIRLLNRLLEWDGRGLGFFVNSEACSFHQKWAKAIPYSLRGGIDVESITSLVTGLPPMKRLQRRSTSGGRPEYGALLHWYTTKEKQRLSRSSYLPEDTLPEGVEVFRDNEAVKENLPFSVDDKIAGIYDIVDFPRYSALAEQSYSERTAWTPYLVGC